MSNGVFKIVAKPRAWWPVTWNGVTEEGEIVTNRIELRFWRFKQPQYIEMLEASDQVRADAMQAVADKQPAEIPVIQAEFVKAIADDWRGVALENGEPLKWSDDNIVMLMGETGLFDRIFAAFQECNVAQKEAREGN